MGTPDQPWQGFDILEQLAQDLPEFDFHVVGLLKPSYSNVYYHGFLSAEKYLPIMMKCHVCIGTLALFRKNMEEACPLKIREYIANGFPIIIGYKEAMFEDHSHLPEWALEIDPRNPNLVSIREFCVRVKDRIVSNAEAFPLVDSSILEKRRVDFFDSILSQE
ncbi:glycosyltransferase family protein [Algoriphagus lacus]|nr:glycosyltransferase family 4 protein [Algoriphagus lacus]